MNPVALIKNAYHTWQICPAWPDRLNRMAWLYSDKPYLKFLSKESREISFCYDPPVGALRVIVRDNHGADGFIMSEVFDHRYYDFSLPSEPATILDLGAHAGYTALFFARKYPSAKLACVEPVPGNFDMLRKNLALNGVQAAVFQAAVAVDDGRLSMQIDERAYGHKVAGIAYGKRVVGKTLDVEAVSIPTLLKRLGWDRIHLLKVDIEGYEGILLQVRCDWLARVDALCIECHEHFSDADLAAVANRWGFSPPVQLPGTWLLTRVRKAG